MKAMPRYFEVKSALAKDPKNRALRKEFNELQKYIDFLERESKRDARHKALRLSRRALQPKPAEQEDEKPNRGKNDLESSSREKEARER